MVLPALLCHRDTAQSNSPTRNFAVSLWDKRAGLSKQHIVNLGPNLGPGVDQSPLRSAKDLGTVSGSAMVERAYTSTKTARTWWTELNLILCNITRKNRDRTKQL